MQSLIRSKSAGVTGGRGTAGAGPGRDLLYRGSDWQQTSSTGLTVPAPRATKRKGGNVVGKRLQSSC